jgi:hypothetical protein
VNSQLTEDFVACFRRLPREIQELARKNYRLWRENPAHPSLQFKRVNKKEPIYSVRVRIGYRAVGLLEENTVTWFWIGPHAEYDHLIGG